MAASIQIKKVSPWMERMADLMIANPGIKIAELAEAMERSYVWISIVKNSDMFQDYWRQRSGEHSSAVTDDIKAKAFAASEMALEALNAQLEINQATNAMTSSQLLEIVDVTQKRFGYGQEARIAPQINLNLGLATPEQLADARKKLRKVQEAEVIELKAVEDGREASGT